MSVWVPKKQPISWYFGRNIEANTREFGVLNKIEQCYGIKIWQVIVMRMLSICVLDSVAIRPSGTGSWEATTWCLVCVQREAQRKFWKGSFCPIYCKNEDHSQQSDNWHCRKCGPHPEGAHSHCEVAPLEGLQSINVELSLLGKKKKRLQVDKRWDNRKELTMVRTICNHV